MIRNFEEAHVALRQFYGPSAKQGGYTLDNIKRLLTFVGNPQNKLRVIHVAGTSGKTSTAYYTAALLESKFSKVGLTVSPHVDEVNERVQINHVPLPEQEFCTELDAFLKLVEQSGVHPSYFECMVAFAFWEFDKQHVDYAVVEVGLGGLLDCTNVVEQPDKVCVITDIGLDHTDILGDTIEKIAEQKAGIIQEHTVAFMYNQDEEVMRPVHARCKLKHATLFVVDPDTIRAPGDMPLFQQRNLYLAAEVVNYVFKRDAQTKLTGANLSLAATTIVPARMETFLVAGKTIIIDGSHNGQKIGTLAKSIAAKYPGQSVAAVVGFVKDIDERWQRGADAVMAFTDHLIITSFTADQDTPKSSTDMHQVADYCIQTGFASVEVEGDSKEALAKLLKRSEPVLVVTGSFYLLNHIRPLIKRL